MQGTTITDNAAGPTVVENMPMYVKKIESNNQIIWGSQSAFPYRRLEYIESDGTAAFDTQANCARNSFIRLTLEDMSNGSSVQGNGRDNPGSTEARFFVGFDGGKYWFGLGSSTKQGGTATSGSHVLELYGPDCQGGSKYKVDGVSTAWRPTFPSSVTWYSLFLFANRNNTTTGFNCQSKVRVYRAEYGYQYQSGGTWNEGYNRKLIPVQRKSDGKLGFYDLQDNTFMYQLVSGSGANALSAGPTADEYWDLTAPA